ncbi:MAG: HsdR family type I site-specific deoxyribonuclease [Bacteroidetes bacterium]|nr:HsdR family type I site-specific deoxyribonuclease [Bacteroidota bacterium]
MAILSNDNLHKGEQYKSLKLDELNHVEEPFLKQLEGLNWDEVIRLDMYNQEPADSYRNDYSQVILLPHLQKALKKINPFLTDNQVDDVVKKITTFHKGSLLEANRHVLELLLENTTVSRNELTGEISPTVRYIDFETPENNSFVAISQFKVKIPGTEHHIVPDITLFLNGLPIVVVECKSPRVKDPVNEAIEQLMRYSEQRNYPKEGNQELFYFNQFIITTCRQDARFGTITTHTEKYFYKWTDPYPFKLDDLDHGSTSPNYQQRLIAGMLSKRNLLDLIQSFTIFTSDETGRTIKIVGRYQQFRAVKESIKRLIDGKNRDERSGIIWHTQGSGKSLTMMFMVREMRLKPELLGWKIVFITDRDKLEKQLTETSQSIGFTVKVANKISKLKKLLTNDSPDLIMAMIHKFQEREYGDIFPELNTSHQILTMTDEAHRSQYSVLAANLDRAIPNASRIAYTGTPIDKTEKTYGDYIDKYTMKQSNSDKVTLEIVYEGRTHNAEVEETEKMDKKFEDVFSNYNLMERMQILGYGSRDAYLEAKDTIKSKAEDIIDHYTEFIFTNGFKAQVVASSRVAAFRYKAALETALVKKIEELQRNNPYSINIEVLQKLEVAPIFSGSHNDEAYLNPFTDKSYQDRAIKRFKMPFEREKEGINGNVGIIVVNSMLLTGFDAPIEQVLYLDKVIVAHSLLQAIARVNRVGPPAKEVGFVVDYVGIGHHLKRALEDYDEREQKNIIELLKKPDEEIKELKEAVTKLWNFLEQNNCTDLSDPDAFFDLFYDEDLRFEYILAFRELTKAFNSVLPQKEALEYFKDYRKLLEINMLASKHLRDERLSMRGIPPKLRSIADEFLKSKGIQQKVAPISIMDNDFQKQTQKRNRSKTKAAEVEHAIRHFIDLNIDEDPELFASFSKALENILKEFRGNWDMIYKELEKLRNKINSREKEATYGLDRKKQMPFFRIFKAELFENKELNEDEISKNVDLTQNIFNLVRTEIQLTGFWDSVPAQNKLKAELQKLLLSAQYIDLPNIRAKYRHIVSRIMELSKSNHFLITAD